jgi:hypothetical protein
VSNGAPPNSPAATGVLNNLLDRFVALITRLPTAAQLVVLLAALGIGGTLAYLKYVRVPPASNQKAIAQAPASNYSDGTYDPTHPSNDNNNPQNLEADDKAKEDNAANNWHTEHQAKDSPREMSIVDFDKDNYLHYRYYANTDKCVYVIRAEAGQVYHQWIKDPQYHSHDVHKA